MATVLAIVLSIFIVQGYLSFSSLTILNFFVLGIGALFLLIASIAYSKLPTLALRSQKQLLSTSFELFQTPFWKGVRYFLFFFPFLSLVIATIDWQNYSLYVFILWLILFGIAVDALYFSLHQSTALSNPNTILKQISESTKREMDVENTSAICQNFDTYTELALKALHTKGIVFCRDAIDELRGYSESYFKMAARKKMALGASLKESGFVDQVNYSVIYLFQNLELLFHDALTGSYETLASEIVIDAGKIALYAARADVTWGIIPIHKIGKFALMARREGMKEVVIKSSITLQRIAEAFLSDAEILRQDIKELMNTLIGRLDEITKEMFRQDKSTKIAVMTKPFKEIEELLKQDKFSNRDDTPLILIEISRILAEYEALEKVMGAIPKVSAMEPNKT